MTRMTSNSNTAGPANGSWEAAFDEISPHQSPNNHTSLGLFEQHVATGWIVQDLGINKWIISKGPLRSPFVAKWLDFLTALLVNVLCHTCHSQVPLEVYTCWYYMLNTISHTRTLESVAKKIGACWVLTLPRGEGPEQKHWSPPQWTLMFCCFSNPARPHQRNFFSASHRIAMLAFTSYKMGSKKQF